MFFYFSFTKDKTPQVFELHLNHWLPKAISRCRGNCGKKINDEDSLIIKFYGTTSWADQKTAREKSKYGPMYIYFIAICLKKYDNERFYLQDEDFDYTQISVNRETVKDFNESESTLLQNLRL